jgi:hypothetical protein
MTIDTVRAPNVKVETKQGVPAVCRRDVVGKRGQAILHHRDVVAFGLKDRDYLRPTRVIGEGTVDEDDVHRLRGRRLDGHRGNRKRYGSGGRQARQSNGKLATPSTVRTDVFSFPKMLSNSSDAALATALHLQPEVSGFTNR